MKRAEFDWEPVLSAVHSADLSDAMVGMWVNPDPDPAWPSQRYRELHRELMRRITAPARKPPRAFGMTVAELEKAIDALFIELAVEAPDPVTAERWEKAAGWLVEAKRHAHATQRKAG